MNPLRLTLGLFVLRLALGSLCLLGLSARAATPPPNILFILADDQGYGDVSALNPQSKIATPHLDRLAKEGMAFTDAHSSSSVCTPTRYSILTGRYHWRTRLQSGVLGGYSRPLIAPNRLTLASFLAANGYETACIGKWHLGMDWQLKNGSAADDGGNFATDYQDAWQVNYAAPIQDGPLDRGFHHYFGISASLDMPPFVFIRDRLATEIPTTDKTWIRKGPAGAAFEAVDVLPRFTDEAVRFLGERAGPAKAGKPFFLYFPLNAPHTPIVPAPEWQGKSGINAYADFVLEVDHCMGRVLTALDDQGLTANTLVLYTSDNGCSPSANIPELQAAGHFPSHIYRGHKADIFEGGHRLPFLVRWPGHVAPGSRCGQLVEQCDFFATCAEILGKPLPPEAAEDSFSFLPLLANPGAGPTRESLVSQSISGQFSIRRGNWKLCLCPGSGGWSDPRPGKVDFSTYPPSQLFDLSKDPGETTNLIAQQPEIAQELQELLARQIAAGRSTPGPNQPNDVADIVMIKPVPPLQKPRSKPKAGAGK